MKVLELFAGTRSIGKAFEAHGHEVFSVEWDKSFDRIDLYADIGTLTAAEILEKFGRPDVIWASPDCSTFSVAAISKHRRLDKATGSLEPITEYARFCDAVDQNVLQLINDLLPVRRGSNETDGHLDQPPGAGVQTAVQERRPLPCPGATRCPDWHPRAERIKRAGSHPRTAVRAYRDHLRKTHKRGGRRVASVKVDTAALHRLGASKNQLTRQQLKTLRGQILAGDPGGAMKGLERILLLNGSNAVKNH